MHGVKKLSLDMASYLVLAYDLGLGAVLAVDAVPVKRNELDLIRRLSVELDVTNALISLGITVFFIFKWLIKM